MGQAMSDGERIDPADRGRHEAAQLRDVRATELRVARCTYEQIAATLGFAHRTSAQPTTGGKDDSRTKW